MMNVLIGYLLGVGAIQLLNKKKVVVVEEEEFTWENVRSKSKDQKYAEESTDEEKEYEKVVEVYKPEPTKRKPQVECEKYERISEDDWASNMELDQEEYMLFKDGLIMDCTNSIDYSRGYLHIDVLTQDEIDDMFGPKLMEWSVEAETEGEKAIYILNNELEIIYEIGLSTLTFEEYKIAEEGVIH